MTNAYLYEKTYFHVYIEQPTNSTEEEDAPGHICVLMKSKYGIRQAGRIWGSLLVENLFLKGFKQSTNGERMPFLSIGPIFVLRAIVVGDLSSS